MLPLRIENADVIMKAPHGHEGEVNDLHVLKLIDDTEVVFYISRWEPTPDELTMLNNGGSVQITCMGIQPPLAITTAEHVEEINDTLDA